MEVSVWWVLIGASAGLCSGIVLFAVMSMASEREGEYFSDLQAPPRT
jgi:hypothetical protein